MSLRLVQIILQTELLVRLLYHILQKRFLQLLKQCFCLKSLQYISYRGNGIICSSVDNACILWTQDPKDLQALAQLQNQRPRTICSYPSPWILSIKSNTESQS